MRLNRETEIGRALHEVRLTSLLLQINGRNEKGRKRKRHSKDREDVMRGQINWLLPNR